MKLFWTLVLAIFVACTPTPEDDLGGQGGRERNPNLFYYKIQVDSVAIQPGSIRAMGVIGSNGCHRFEYVESSKAGNELHVTFWGSRPVKQDVICTMQIPYMNEVVALPSDITEVVVHQPDGSEIRRGLSR